MIRYAEVTGTHLAPISKVSKTPSVTAFKKAELAVNEEVTEKAPVQAPQKKVLRPSIDVSKMEAPKEPEPVKRASRYALEDSYPLDTYGQVKQASAYFDTWWREFDLPERHKFASNLVARASELSVPVSDTARTYAAVKTSSAAYIDMMFDVRQGLLGTVEDKRVLSKIAAAAHTLADSGANMGPLLEVLSEFDKKAGIDRLYGRTLPDPFESFYGEKTASFSETIGNTTVTEERLDALAKSGRQWVEKMFGEDVAEEFCKDPLSIYKSLPTEQRKMLGRLAEKIEAEGTL